MPSDVAIGRNGDIYIADMHHQRVRKSRRARRTIISTVAGNGRWGNSGDGGPALERQLAGPAGIAVVQDALGRVTLFIADYYNGRVRAVGPDGIIANVSDERRRQVRRADARRVRAEDAAGSTSPTPATTRSSSLNIPEDRSPSLGAREPRAADAAHRPKKASA